MTVLDEKRAMKYDALLARIMGLRISSDFRNEEEFLEQAYARLKDARRIWEVQCQTP